MEDPCFTELHKPELANLFENYIKVAKANEFEIIDAKK
jgi:hypothetical protein